MNHAHEKRGRFAFLRACEAVSALDYSILMGVVAIAIAVAMLAFGDDMDSAIASIGDKGGVAQSQKLELP